jgi:hypothetical protein
MATSNRGRPVILDKVELSLGDGNTAIMRLVGDGSTVQIELPKSWTLQTLQRSVTMTGGRTKVTFVQDVPEAAPVPVVEAPAPVPESKPRTRTPRKRAAKAAATEVAA